MKDYFLGIDVGTTAIKLSLIERGKEIWRDSRQVTTYGDDRSKYQSKKEILQGITELILRLPEGLKERIGKISFSTAMHSLFPVSSENSDRIFLWSDRQASEVMKEFRHTGEATRFYLKTGTPIHSMSTFAKILALKEQEDYAAVSQWLGLKEMILKFFTGYDLIDYSVASATGLMNLRDRKWDQEILNYLAIDQKQLGALTSPTEAFPISKECCEKLKLDRNIKIYPGASDGCLAAWGGQVTTGLSASLSIGTSAAVRKVVGEIKLDPQKQNFCYYLDDDHYVIGAPSNNGGCVLAWANQQLFATDDFYQDIPMMLSKTTPGANGVRFMPYLNGERAPYWDDELKAEFKDLTTTNTVLDLKRSVLEGLLLNIKQLAVMVDLQEAVTISGGFFQTAELVQLTADILGTPCLLAAENEPVFGLYYLLHESEEKTVKDQFILPDDSAVTSYQELFINYFK